MGQENFEQIKGANVSLSGNFRASDFGRFSAIHRVNEIRKSARKSQSNAHAQSFDGQEEEKEDETQEDGEYTFENGAVYNGQWRGRMRHGHGEQSWPDGARYEGEWRNNQVHGRGVFYHVDGDVFDGEWC